MSPHEDYLLISGIDKSYSLAMSMLPDQGSGELVTGKGRSSS
jgi:hypothetical protein